jgi:hypothetical protein
MGRDRPAVIAGSSIAASELTSERRIGTNYLWLSCVQLYVGSSYLRNGGWTIEAAQKLDLKIDDGLPFTGRIQEATNLQYINGSNGATPMWGWLSGCEPQTGGGYNNTGYLNQYNVQHIANANYGPLPQTPCVMVMNAGW